MLKPVFITLKIPFNIVGIAIFPFVFLNYWYTRYYGENKMNVLRKHEEIHFWQQLQLLVVPFYLLYGIFQLTHGYKKNPFEVEAFANQDNLNYKVKPFGWLKHIKKS